MPDWRGLGTPDTSRPKSLMVALPAGVLAVVMPFGLHDLYVGEYAFGVAVIACVLLLCIAVYRIHRTGSSGWWGYATDLTAAAIVIAAAWVYGPWMLFWAFPLALLNYYLFSLPAAAGFNAVLAAGMVAVVAGQLPAAAVARLLGAYLVTNGIAAVFAWHIDRYAQHLAHRATVDYLTGLGNRQAMEAAIERLLAMRHRHAQTACLLVIDLDHFKRVNDELGHAAGDEILCTTAKLLRHRLRATDEVFRFGGEEFVLLLPETPRHGAIEVAEQLREEFAAHPFDRVGRLTLSIGLAEGRPDDTMDDWIRRADHALYAAKRAGRNRLRVAEAMPVDEAPEEALPDAP